MCVGGREGNISQINIIIIHLVNKHYFIRCFYNLQLLQVNTVSAFISYFFKEVQVKIIIICFEKMFSFPQPVAWP